MIKLSETTLEAKIEARLAKIEEKNTAVLDGLKEIIKITGDLAKDIDRWNKAGRMG